MATCIGEGGELGSKEVLRKKVKWIGDGRKIERKEDQKEITEREAWKNC